MNLRRLAPVISVALILGLWVGAYLKWGRGGPAYDASNERAGKDREVEQKLDSLRTSVLGDDTKTRGDDVHAPQIRPPRAAYDYTPREVCMKMKLENPEKYKNIDCGSARFDSAVGWKWQ